MRFETNPQLILTVQEFETLDNALKLCRDMDCETAANCCDNCPQKGECSGLEKECPFSIAHKTLKQIIDMAIVK